MIFKVDQGGFLFRAPAFLLWREPSSRDSGKLHTGRVFLIAMDDSDWAIHDSYSAARWRMLADFD